MKTNSPYYSIQDSTRIFGSEGEVIRYIKGLLLDDFQIYEISQNQGELVPYHAHAHEEIILMLEGHMRLVIEEDIIDIKAGDLMTIEPWAIHLATFPDAKGAKFYLCFPKNKISVKKD